MTASASAPSVGSRWLGLPSPFVFGWREVFIPLAVVAHGEHGPALAMAGLAVASARVGGWFITRSSGSRRVRTSALLAGLALALLGLTPEEGPAGLLLWLVFGIAWSLVEVALANQIVRQRIAGLALLIGMALAGPLAAGPGAWLIAALCFLIAWRAGPDWQARPEQPVSERPAGAGWPARWLPFLFGASYLTWFWLMPARLLQDQQALVWIGALAATHWLARLLAAGIAARRLVAGPPVLWQTVAAVALAAILVALALAASSTAATLAGLVASGIALGVLSASAAIARPERGQQPGEAQALGEVLGAVAGALLAALLGPPAVFIAAALAAAAMALTLVKGAR